jgi:hypothetical protein
MVQPVHCCDGANGIVSKVAIVSEEVKLRALGVLMLKPRANDVAYNCSDHN